MIKENNKYYSLKKEFRKYNFYINGECKLSTEHKYTLIKYFKELNLNFKNRIRDLNKLEVV